MASTPAPTLEDYLAQGEIAAALLLKGSWSEKEVEIIRAAWEEGFTAGYNARTRDEARGELRGDDKDGGAA